MKDSEIRHSAGVILIRKDSFVLMQHRENKPNVFWPDHWAYPGGSVEGNKYFETAAKRELEEETGYKADKLYPLVEEDYTSPDGEQIRRHVFWAMYDGIQEIQCNEGLEMKFVALEELSGKEFIPRQEHICRLAVSLAKAQGFITV